MSENRPEWQPGTDPAAGKDNAPEDGQYAPPAPPAYPGAGAPDQNATGYPSYGQQAGYPSQNQQQDSYPGYGQETPAPMYGQQATYPAYGQTGYPVPQPNPGQAMGIAGLITSFFVPIVGLILSIVGLNQSRKASMGNVPAVVGIIVGGLGTLLALLFFIFIFVAIGAESGSGY